jgi:long-chain acyl-CoA synthetase
MEERCDAWEAQVQLKDDHTPWSINAGTVCAIFEETASNYPENIYISTDDGTVTYREAYVAVDYLAREIEHEVRDKVVGLFLPNSISFLVTYQAVLRAGGKPALINSATPPGNISKMLDGSDVALVFAGDDVPGVPTRAITDLEVLNIGRTKGPVSLTPASQTADDVGAILFSGGTTGLPKRISHSHRAVIAKMERMEWGWATNPNETWLPVAPFSHVYGFLMGVVNPILKGAKVVIPERFKPDLIVELMARERVTVFGGGPPAIYQALMAAGNFSQADLSALRVCPGGGAPFPIATHEKWEASTGLKIFEGLGMTEIAPIAVNHMPQVPRYGSVGRPCPDTIVEIVDVETGTQQMPADTPGEIRVRGPHMMTAYEGNPEETAATLRDGFIYTGDIGSLSEDGYLTVTDRKKDVIFHKGFNVFPREIEEALMAHSAVSQVCVVGRPDDRAGEVAVAFIAGSKKAETAEILDFCKARLSGYKVPGEIHFVDQLPLTANGKLDRLELRERANS